MASLPRVNVNMIVYNSVSTVGVAIESVLHQTWPAVSLTVIDNASTDGTFEVLQNYAADHPAIGVRRNRCNTGDGINIQRAFWFGDADYVMLKTGRRSDCARLHRAADGRAAAASWPRNVPCCRFGLYRSRRGQILLSARALPGRDWPRPGGAGKTRHAALHQRTELLGGISARCGGPEVDDFAIAPAPITPCLRNWRFTARFAMSLRRCSGGVAAASLC